MRFSLSSIVVKFPALELAMRSLWGLVCAEDWNTTCLLSFHLFFPFAMIRPGLWVVAWGVDVQACFL